MAAFRSLRVTNRLMSSSAIRANATEQATQELASNLSEQISNHSETCSVLADSLDQTSRRKLLEALVTSESRSAGQGSSIEGLFKSYDKQQPFDLLDRTEFRAAVLADRAARAAADKASTSGSMQPSSLAIALASSIPFIGMGAVDNTIMLIAGSEIDALFGARLGLSTLAAAGLGNMVSDVAGVSMANRIESLTRKAKWINNAAYKAGSGTPRGRAAKFTGAVVGVSFGCLIGMAPLLFMEKHDHEPHDSKPNER